MNTNELLEKLKENKRIAIILAVGLICIILLLCYDGTPSTSADTTTVPPNNVAGAVSVSPTPVMPIGYQPNSVVRNVFNMPIEMQDNNQGSNNKVDDKFNEKREEFKKSLNEFNNAVSNYERVVSSGEKGQNAPVDKPLTPALVGIVGGEGRQVAILRYGTESRTVRINQTIGGYTLLEIGENTATVTGPSGTLVLKQGR